MGSFSTAVWLSGQALEFAFFPPLLLAFAFAAINFLWAALKQRPFHNHLWKPYHWLALTQALFFPAAISVGVIWANPADPFLHHSTVPFAKRCLDVVDYASLASCGFWVWRMKGFRWWAASLMAMAELVVWAALFVAGMSITGEWL